MSEYAPQAIKDLFARIQAAMPQAVLSGIVGDSSHVYGYHRCRNVLPASDYSVGETPRDQAGDGDAASALDVSLPPDLMRTASSRLMAACQANDPRVANLREWFGTVDGSTVTGWDRLTGGYTSSDDSHLWHVHFSFFRDSATNADALAPIASVVAGSAAGAVVSPTTASTEDELPQLTVPPKGRDQIAVVGAKKVALWAEDGGVGVRAIVRGSGPVRPLVTAGAAIDANDAFKFWLGAKQRFAVALRDGDWGVQVINNGDFPVRVWTEA